MVNLEISTISELLSEGILDNELDKDIRAKVLDKVPEEHYDIACVVFHEARKAYFQLGFTLLRG